MQRIVLSLILAASLAAPASGQNVGDPAPDFRYSRLGGGEIARADYSGQVMFIFLFGNTCPFCLGIGGRTESDIHRAFAGHPRFTAIGLDLWDNSSTTASVTAFRSQTGITYPLGLKAGSMASMYGTTYDRLLVIGPDGVIRFKGTSNVSSTLNQARAVIEGLLTAIAADTEEGAEIPGETVSLGSAYPNPFSSRVTVPFETSVASTVRVTLHDLLGREVAVLADGYRPTGAHEAVWNPAQDVPPGLYFVNVTTPSGSRTGTVVRR